MAFAYLLDPQNQYMTKSGAINTAGIIRVFDASTDDPAVTYKDFNGTANPEAIVLDNNGRCVCIADADKAYRVEVYDRYNSLMWTTSPLWCEAAGGGVQLNITELVSSDGSVDLVKTTVGSTTTWDLSVAKDSTQMLEWLKAEGYTVVEAGHYLPTYSSGSMLVGDYGVQLHANQYYHFTSHFSAVVPNPSDPIYDSIEVVFRTADAILYTKKFTVDCTTALPQEFEVSFDVMAGSDMEVGVFVSDIDSNTVSVGLSDMEVHRVYSGAPYIPDGIASREWVEDNYQEKLTAGANIVIEDNVISATAEPQLNADWDATSGVQEILHKPDLSIYARSADLSTVATTGNYDDLLNKPEIPEQVNADWDASSGKAEILHKPDLSVYAEKTELEDYQEKLTAGDNITIENNVISATAEPQVNADWDATSGVSMILNKPTEKPLVAGANISISEGADSVTISATAAPQQNADWDATSGVTAILNKPVIPPDNVFVATYNITTYQELSAAKAAGKAIFLTGVSGALSAILPMTSFSENPMMAMFSTVIGATEYQAKIDQGTWSYNNVSIQADWNQAFPTNPAYINNKPTIPSGTQLVPSATSADANKVLTVSFFGFPTWAAAPSQVQSDWDATSGMAEILHKPDLSIYAQSADLATVATTGSYSDLSGLPTIPEAQVNSDWSATSGVAQILNKPTEKELVAGENVTITESGSTVTISASASAAQVNADWDATSGAAEILHKPDLSIYAQSADLAAVATSGSYTDLLDKPTIPEQVNADWNATTGKAEILNKPDLSIYAQSANLATVATTGSYTDLTNTPTIPAAQVNSDWDATSGVQQILNKPEETTLTAGENITITESGSTLTISSTSAPQVNADWDATSGVSEILNKPTLATVATSGSYNDLSNTPDLSVYAETSDLSSVAFSGSYSDLSNTPDLSIYAQSADLASVATTGSYNSLTDTPTIPAAQVNSDWDATSGVSEILNKPDLVDIVAGPGIVVDNPDGNTLRVSTIDTETVLWEGDLHEKPANAVTLNERTYNFERIKVFVVPYYSNTVQTISEHVFELQLVYRTTQGNDSLAYISAVEKHSNVTTQNMIYLHFNSYGTSLTLESGSKWVGGTFTEGITSYNFSIVKIVGVHRIANN